MARVSVITIVKDHAAGLEVAAYSLFKQSYFDWGLVIVVGKSGDASVAVAQGLQQFDPRIVIINQIGSGIYGAMNEGLGIASGEFIWFMNAGDEFFSKSTLAQAVNQISKTNSGVVIGGYRVEGANPKRSFHGTDGNVSEWGFAFNRRGGCHQAMIFQTSCLKEIGGFDTSYSLAADFDLVLRIIQKSRAYRVAEIYATIEPGGRADQGIFLVHSEKHQIRRRLLGGPIVSFTSFLWTSLARLKITFRQTLEYFIWQK